MKVLMVGVYRDGTGWARASTDYILALDSVGVDVVPRAIRLNRNAGPLPARILELEAKSSAGSNVAVQHILPHMMDYQRGSTKCLNVGLYASETSGFPMTSWADRLSAMDLVVVVNRQMVTAARNSGVTAPIAVVPHATDITRFQRSYKPLDRLQRFKDDGRFLFYTVGEFNRRKNLAALVKAFHLEFHPDEPVELVIKTSKPGIRPAQCHQEVVKFCGDIKEGLKLHARAQHYKQEIVLTDRVTDEGMMRLHASCDAFVQPSYGEAWSIPAFDAMAMGKTPIVTACTGYLDYVCDATGWLVDCRDEPVFGVGDTFQDLFVGTETWSSADVLHLRRCMREAYANEALRKSKSLNGIARAYDFSYENVGTQLKEALYERALGKTPGVVVPGNPGRQI